MKYLLCKLSEPFWAKILLVLFLKCFLCVRNRENQENYATPAVDSLNYQSPVTINPTQDKPLAQLAYGSFAEHDFHILNNF